MSLPSTVVWGVDPVARSLAAKFLSSQGADGVPPPGLQLFDPGADAAHDLRQTLALMWERESAGSGGGVPEVVMLACAFAPEAQATPDLLRTTSGVLATALPGLQSIVLVVFLPPPAATDEEQVRTWQFFVALEPLAGSLPFLNIVFINQLSRAILADVDSAGLWCEILARELRDESLKDIRGRGFAGTRNPLKAARRSCGYSTAGHLRLVYASVEALAYLRARFCDSMFEEGFLNPAAVSDHEAKLIGERVAGLFGMQSNFWSSRLPTAGQVTAGAFSQPLDPTNKAQAVVGLEQEFDRALAPAAARFRQDLDLGAESLNDAFRDYLRESAGLIAGANRFLETLTGDAAGIGRFEKTFCWEPLAKSIDEHLGPRFTATLARAGVNVPPARKQDESGRAWLVRAVDSVRNAAREAERGPASPLRFFCAAFDCLSAYLDSPPCTPDGTRQLLREVAEQFAEESMALFEIAAGLGKERESAAGKLKDLPGQYRYWQRVGTKRTKFHTEQVELQRKLAGIETRQRDLGRSFESTREILLTIVNQAILPHLPRVRVKERIAQQASATATEFNRFVEAVGTPLKNHADESPSGMETPNPWDESALTDRRRELLYKALEGGKSMVLHARGALAFTGASRDAAAQPSYQNCRNLHDHWKAGSTSLLDRIDDYASTLLAPIEQADILEIIELEGKDAAQDYLRQRASQAASALELASGPMPLVDGILHATFAIKVLGGSDSRLKAEYESVFLPNRTFIDSGRKFSIEIVSLKFGFPAFLLQGLQEARRLARATTGELTPDLWPEPPAGVKHATRG